MKKHFLTSLLKENDGAIAVLWALVLPVVIGCVGLGADTGLWYQAKRDLQNAVDVAAVAAAYDISGGNPQAATMLATATSELERHGFDADDEVTVTVHYPPITGAYTDNTQAVEVVVTQPQSRVFSALFVGEDPNVRVRAISTRQPIGSACVLALNQSANSALLFQGSTTVNLSGCSSAANSSSSSAIDIAGSSTLSTHSLYTAGNYVQSGSSSLTTTEAAVTNGAQISDPYASLAVPSYSGCNQNNYSANNTATINPGVYCNGMDFKSNAVVTMNPGVYIVDRGDFKATAGAQITGTGVTIIFTSSTGASYPNITINGGATVTLSAMTSGNTAGVLFYKDRNAPAATNKNKFNGTSTTNYTGAIYFPKQEVQFSGNNSSGGGKCTKIIADTITFTGNSYLSNSCPASVVTVNTQGLVSLVE